ncbi:MAG TPA: hypothetical protein VF785_21035 [Gemmatimonadaceae bacterium]
MTDDRFDELMRDAAHTYNRPPDAPLDQMWAAVERTAWNAEPARQASRVSRFSLRSPGWAIAATLVLGIGIGRASLIFHRAAPAQPTAQASSAEQAIASARADSSAAQPYEAETSRYLGQTAALLIALPSEVRAGRADEQFVARAGELLTRTRLLLDSPAASDPSMRSLLDDLELVLAQVVRLQNDTTSRTELDLINRALEQRDVIPRLRNAVADNSAN